jgi:nucleotide-binding universal stress UspA family protein
MFKHILVPLDGSNLAEAAIPVAAELSQKLGAEVTLLHVIEKNAPQEVHHQRHLTQEEDARKYLEGVAASKFAPGSVINFHVHSEEVSKVAASIVQHSDEFTPDLIILCAHGEGGIHDFVVGSIPQQVIAAALIPVLLLQPQEGDVTELQSIKMMVSALDGKSDHDASLEVAADLAEAIGASLHLVRVVPTLSTLKSKDAASGTLLPVTTNAILEMEEENAVEYLDQKLQWLHSRGIHASAEVERGDPAQEVVKSAINQKTDLIILGTHGKKGMGALWAGSVAPLIVSRTRLPILLVPVRRDDV